MLQKEIADGVVAEVSIDKRGKAFSKEFTIGVGVGLTRRVSLRRRIALSGWR